jgi:hypothetical protein
MNLSMFGWRENAGKRHPLALPASGRDPPASGAVAVAHPQLWLAHRVSLSGSLQLSRPPSLGLSVEDKKRTKRRKPREKEERKKIEKKKKNA